MTHFLDLRRDGEGVDRLPFTMGFLLLILAHSLAELLVARLGWGEPAAWTLPMIHPPSWLFALATGDLAAAKIGWAIDLPAAAFGGWLALQRWRQTRLSLWTLVLLAFPVLVWIAFFILATAPAVRPEDEACLTADPGAESYVRWRRGAGAAIPIVFCVFFVYLASLIQPFYGLALFAGLPLFLGLWNGWLATWSPVQSHFWAQKLTTQSLPFMALGMLAGAVEGLICLLMTAPIAWAMAAIGTAIGYGLRDGQGRYDAYWRLGGTMLLLPMLLGAEAHHPPEPSVFDVETTIEIDASPEVVWHHVVSFSTLPEPTDWLFKTGIAYPIRARIEGTGAGAVRYCEFSTGPFVEPIDVWDPPHRLSFTVASSPAPMEELNPFHAKLHPPHLDGFLVSQRGQFLLEALPDGRTRLIGQTWYQHGLWPETYWTLWSEFIIHRIHLRVLEHIRILAESSAD